MLFLFIIISIRVDVGQVRGRLYEDDGRQRFPSMMSLKHSAEVPLSFKYAQMVTSVSDPVVLCLILVPTHKDRQVDRLLAAREARRVPHCPSTGQRPVAL